MIQIETSKNSNNQLFKQSKIKIIKNHDDFKLKQKLKWFKIKIIKLKLLTVIYVKI